MILITAPDKGIYSKSFSDAPSLFLGGSIDNGEASDWQVKAGEVLKDKDLFLVNPRRREWVPNAPESLLRGQINWELDALQRCDAILIYLEENSKSPISLLEMGLWAGNGSMGFNKLIVVCPVGFYRRTNVMVTMDRYGVPVFDKFEEGLKIAVATAKDNYEYTTRPKGVQKS